MKKQAFIYVSALLSLLGSSCVQSQQKKTASPKGYDLNTPIKYRMPENLLEISGIAFNGGNADTFYAIQDEDGKLFYGKLGADMVNHTKFGKHGDYEDVAICGNLIIVLKSNGKLYTFPLSEVKEPELTNVQELDALLPGGEYESMYADEAARKLYVLCKNCDDDKTSKSSSGYILDIAANGTLKLTGNFQIDVKQIKKLSGESKVNFRPSAMAKNPITKQWYIVSSVNELLVVADANWKVVGTYGIDHKVFLQPEGLAFDKKGNMYISNEGDEFSKGNVLKFNYLTGK
jgi:uncharacterized protein YjiK